MLTLSCIYIDWLDTMDMVAKVGMMVRLDKVDMVRRVVFVEMVNKLDMEPVWHSW